MIRDEHLRVTSVHPPGSAYVRPDVWTPGIDPTGTTSPGTAPPQQQAPLAGQPLPKPAIQRPPDRDPIQSAGPVSVLNIHDPRSNPAPTVDCVSTEDIADLGRHGTAGIWQGGRK